MQEADDFLEQPIDSSSAFEELRNKQCFWNFWTEQS